MPNRLSEAVSPYLRSHADNPVDWQQWGAEAFAEAAARDVPLLVSIGYSTCHWCHVMARESFSDPLLAAHLNENFVAIKVDREEYPDVDASYLAAAGAFTENLGWPLNVFVTPQGKAFFAGTYWPPVAAAGHPAFRTVLDAVIEAWTLRRDQVDASAAQVAEALAAQGSPRAGTLPGDDDFVAIVAEMAGYEDARFGGFGTAPKFPVVPALSFLLDRGSLGDEDARALAERTLAAMASSALRDPVEGGFFRYSTRRDWTEPHYERMLYDNALLLGAYARVPDGLPVAEGIADFLGSVMRVNGGAFASAQDSESTVDGVRVEGGYYALDAAARSAQTPPALDEKILTGWNGLAIRALADAGARHDRRDWIAAAAGAAEHLIAHHLREDGTLVRTSIGGRISAAHATLEDYGMFACGLLSLALATGESRYAVLARELVDATIAAASGVVGGAPFAVPGGADPVLDSQGLALAVDPSEGAYPSGLSALADAAATLSMLTADPRYGRVSRAAMELIAPAAVTSGMSFGAALGVMSGLASPSAQLVVVTGDRDAGVTSLARRRDRVGGVVAVVSEEQAGSFAAAGFELFEGRTARDGAATAYLCRDFVCRLPLVDAVPLAVELAAGP
jgi:uncharacterized protein YyaL (SSP411 family)